MIKKKPFTALFIILSVFQSCLMLPCSKSHYFTALDKIENDSVKLQIFSTPKYKSYVVTNMDKNVQVFIQSPVFGNPNEFYLMKNQPFFETEAKQFELQVKDRKFYRDDAYKNVRLKIIDGGGERTIVYNMNKKISGSK